MPERSCAPSPRREPRSGDGLPLEACDVDDGQRAFCDRRESALPAGRLDERGLGPIDRARVDSEIAHRLARLRGYARRDDPLRLDP